MLSTRVNRLSRVIGLMLLTTLSFAGTYSGGSGTPTSPYQLGTSSDWFELTVTSPDWNKHFILTADLNLSAVSLIPVGNVSQPFTGSVNGQGHTLHNAQIHETQSIPIGLFGFVGPGGVLQNLRIEAVSMGGGTTTGGLAGYLQGAAVNCTVTGEVTGAMHVGLLVGYSEGGFIVNCRAAGTVDAESYSGGLVGWNEEGLISGSCFDGKVRGGSGQDDFFLGGLAGLNTGGTISGCYAAGSVDGIAGVGGLVGENTGTLRNCFARCRVSADYVTAGLAGTNHNHLNGLLQGYIINCYAGGSTYGEQNFAGLIGESSGEAAITNSYYLDNGDYPWLPGYSDIIGQPLTDTEMTRQSSFVGWDFADIWIIMDGQSYPALRHFLNFNEADLDNSGTVNVSDLAILAENWMAGA